MRNCIIIGDCASPKFAFITPPLLVYIALVLLFSFSRSETPVAGSLDGFDLSKHMSVADLKVTQWAGQSCVMVRPDWDIR